MLLGEPGEAGARSGVGKRLSPKGAAAVSRGKLTQAFSGVGGSTGVRALARGGNCERDFLAKH